MREKGAVTVEFAAVLPVAALVMLGVAQVGLTVAEAIVVQHAAREGARAFAVTADAGSAEASARTAAGRPVEVVATIEQPYAVVEVTSVARVFPGLAAPTVTLKGRAAMRLERSPP